MKKLSIFLAALSFIGMTAHAATPVQSEYFYQTDVDRHQVTPELGYETSRIDPETGSSTDVTTSVLNVKYEYGLLDMLSMGAQIGYANAVNDRGPTTVDERGLTDLLLFARARQAFIEQQSLHYGATLNVSLGDREEDVDGNDFDVQSGGIGLAPYVGYQWLVGANTIGVNVSTEFDLVDRTVEESTAGVPNDVERTGGNTSTLSGFWESPIPNGLLGIALYYNAVNTLEETDEGATATIDGENNVGAQVYVPYYFNEASTFIGSADYSVGVGDQAEVDSSDAFLLNVAGRFTF